MPMFREIASVGPDYSADGFHCVDVDLICGHQVRMAVMGTPRVGRLVRCEACERGDSHTHSPASTRSLTLRDGTERTVETCECGAVRTIDHVTVDGGSMNGHQPMRVASHVSEWRHHESERAG